MSTHDLAANADTVPGYARAPNHSSTNGSGRDADETNARVQESDGLVIDHPGHEARIDGRAVKLTAREFKLLSFLFERRGQALSREQVLESVWGHEYHGGRRTVDVHVRRLRAKLHTHLPLETVRGVGYKLRAAST